MARHDPCATTVGARPDAPPGRRAAPPSDVQPAAAADRRFGVGSRTRAAAGIALMVAAIFLFGIMDGLAKHLSATYPPLQIVWGRYAFHLLVMLVLVPRTGLAGLVRTSRPGLQILRGALLAVSTLCLVTAVRYIPLADAYAVGFVSPLLVTVFAIPILRERVGWRRWTAVVVGFVGVLIVVRPGLGVMHWAALLPLVMAATFGLYQILTRLVSGGESQLMMLFYTALVGTVVMSVLAPLVWQPVAPRDWALLVAIGTLGAVGHLMLIRALAIAPASLLSPFIYTQIVWGLLIGYFAFGDLPDAPTVIGTLIIVASGLYVFYREAVLGKAS
jgi:drug/metabolite transporter (DMT)-like permease